MNEHGIQYDAEEDFTAWEGTPVESQFQPCVIVCSKNGCKIIHTGRPEMVRPEGDGYVSDEY